MPRLVIAAPSSGSGKTTVATGLMAALRGRGLRVAPFKVGPDYIDPGYHTLAAGRPGRNLDPVLVGQDRIGPLFRHGSRDADIAVVEGVMGLFDGKVGAGGFGSTAHVAGLLGAPVVLVVDGRGQGRSLAALLHGFRGYDPTVRLAGVVLNQVGSARHAEVLQDACAEVGLPVLGTLRRQDSLAVPSRHLGLITAAEHGPSATAAVDAMAALVAAAVDLAAVRRIADTADALTTPPWDPATEIADAAPPNPSTPSARSTPAAASPAADVKSVDAVSDRPVIAVAGGPAFTFGYAEHAELLAAAGADVVTLDPLRDNDIPADVRGLVLPGGFPEQHVEALSDNEELRAAVAAFAAAGNPVHAECGGLLYLTRELDGRPMCGVLPATARMSGRLTLGYRDAVAATDSVLHPVGGRVAGHEFHRTMIEPDAGSDAGTVAPAWHWRSTAGVPVDEGYVRGSVHASYLHTHPAAQPRSVARFVAAARSVR